MTKAKNKSPESPKPKARGMKTDTKWKAAATEGKKKWKLRLYIAGQTPKSMRALTNLKALCAENLGEAYTIEVIDLLEKPQLARGDQIVAIPTLVKNIPLPFRKIIGDLSNKERVLVGLDLRSDTLADGTQR